MLKKFMKGTEDLLATSVPSHIMKNVILEFISIVMLNRYTINVRSVRKYFTTKPVSKTMKRCTKDLGTNVRFVIVRFQLKVVSKHILKRSMFRPKERLAITNPSDIRLKVILAFILKVTSNTKICQKIYPNNDSIHARWEENCTKDQSIKKTFERRNQSHEK